MIEKTLIDKMLRRIKYGSLRVTYWDGDTRDYGEPTKKPELHATVKDKGVIREILRDAGLGVGESYMEGTLLIDGPLNRLAELGHDNLDVLPDVPQNNLIQKLHRNRKSDQKKLIAHHYDLGNDFYKLWLDNETMGYTCSYYKTPHDTLEQAQRQKFDHVLNKLQIKPGQELLDIGFGWGYLLIRAAKRFGVKGFGVSLSEEQHAYAVDWAKREKVDHLATFELMNYQDLPRLKRQFDRVVSIGFFEHVGQGNQNTYFEVVDKMLAPDGISVLHCLSTQEDGPSNVWLDKYIFPGYHVPSISGVTAALADYGFILKDYENIGPHYIPTLAEWLKRFDAHKKTVVGMYDERFYRMWRFYLASCMASFRNGDISLSQWTFTRDPGLDWPLTREYLYKNKKGVGSETQ